MDDSSGNSVKAVYFSANSMIRAVITQVAYANNFSTAAAVAAHRLCADYLAD